MTREVTFSPLSPDYGLELPMEVSREKFENCDQLMDENKREIF